MSSEVRIILITKIGDLDPKILSRLKQALIEQLKAFDFLVDINPKSLNVKANEFNPKRDQYDASQILKRIQKSSEKIDFYRNIGVIDKDIFAHNLNFIFGLAMKPPRRLVNFPAVALISIKRLRKFHKRAPNNEIFRKRILKEAIHELGHTFGLDHCQNYCVMRFSNTLGQTDEKPANYCELCNRRLSNYL